VHRAVYVTAQLDDTGRRKRDRFAGTRLVEAEVERVFRRRAVDAVDEWVVVREDDAAPDRDDQYVGDERLRGLAHRRPIGGERRYDVGDPRDAGIAQYVGVRRRRRDAGNEHERDDDAKHGAHTTLFGYDAFASALPCRPVRPSQMGGMNLTALQFGIYRDGDNNLDRIQSPVIDQAFEVSAHDKLVAFTVEDTTARRDFALPEGARTERYAIRDGAVDGPVVFDEPHDPAARANLAAFVARTLSDAQHNDAKQTWIELVDHGGGDGGGLESDTYHALMTSDDIAGAIADGIALHAKDHPEDANRRIDGVVANQCLMATVGFTDALSRSGVHYLAASPETMLAPGVPTTVAESIVRHPDDPAAMAKAVVHATMSHRYLSPGGAYAPAAAFDVIDCDPGKIATMRSAIHTLDGALAKAARADDRVRDAVLDDAHTVDGMVRFDRGNLPWHADRPAIALYDTLGADERLPANVRHDAEKASAAVADTIVAHAESRGFGPFGGADYRDAVGPTVHFATTAAERDPWAPNVSETHTTFAREVGENRLDRALGTA
jgi:hypothetical protein